MNTGGHFVYALCRVYAGRVNTPNVAYISEAEAIKCAAEENQDRTDGVHWQVKGVWVPHIKSYA